MVRTLGVGGSEAILGRSAPGGPADDRGGARLSLEKVGGKNTREEEVLPPWTPPFLVGGRLRGPPPSFAWPAALYLTLVTARPPAGRAGRGGFTDGKGHSYPQSLPLGGRTVRGTVRSGPGEATINHRCPSAHTGADEGATLYPTFPCRKKARSRLSPQRGFSIAPLGESVAPSSVTFGDSFPPRGSLWVVQPSTKKRPKSGHADGYRISPSTVPLRPTTPKPASGNERPLNQGGRGASPRDSLRPGFL